MEPNYSYHGHQKCEIPDICVLMNLSFSGAFLSFFFLFYFILVFCFGLFCFLRILFWNTENVDTAFSLELLIWFSSYVRKTTVIKSFCAWIGDILQAKPNSVLFNWKFMLIAQFLQFATSFLALKNHQSTLIKFNATVNSFSVWKWYLEELTFKFLSLIFIHRPCPVLMYLFD